MNRLIFLILLTSSGSFAQTEFTQHSNGLIYDEATMKRLGSIVDSLNIRFRECDLAHPYYSLFQGNAIWVELTTADARSQVRDGITLADFEKKYPQAIKARQIWITKSYYTSYQGKPMIIYAGLPARGKRPEFHVKHERTTDKISGWIMNEYENSALYLKELQQSEIPYAYARLIQYVDCMIDTTARVMLPNAGREGDESSLSPKATEFVAWATRFPNEPKRKKNDNTDSAYERWYLAHQRWDSLRLLNLDEKMKTAHYYKSLLVEAAEESITNGNSNALLEFYVARYGNKTDALMLMRARRVVGYCSQDSRPRQHAMNICMLAAETAQWDIFLRSHLDIMNDRFERASDGSYAWARRKTYLQELEELNIPAVDLLIGTSLRVSNVSQNHYWGSINRTGRALADARDKDGLQKQLVTMMQDEKLDVYNRLLIALVFDHYIFNLEKSPRQEEARQQLDAAVNTMPEEIQEVWHKKKK